VLLAVIGTLLLVTYVNGAADRASAGEKGLSTLVVSHQITAGTRVADLKGDVKVQEVPRRLRAKDAVSSLSELQGLVATTALQPGEQVLRSRFGRVGAAGARSVAAPADKVEVTVSLEPQRALGGTVGAGDTVGVFASFKPFSISAPKQANGEAGVAEVDGILIPDGGSTPNSTHLILHKVLVTNVQIDQQDESTAKDDASSDSSAKTAPQRNLLVTLAVSGPDAEKVVFAAEHGTIWLASEPKSVPEGGTTVQTRGSIYK
jgi:pilus assembly protein CpaB